MGGPSNSSVWRVLDRKAKGDLFLSARLEAGKVLRNAIGQAQRAILGQRPNCGSRNDLGVGVKQPERLRLSLHPVLRLATCAPG